MKRLLAIILACLMFLPTLFWSAPAYAAIQQVTINDITEALVPSQLLGGDREFDGHGPDVKATTKLRIGDGGRALYADIYFHAKETTHDWSETEGRWSRKVWDAPTGQTIKRILSDDYSETNFRSQPGGFQLFAPSEDWLDVVDWVIEIVKLFTDENEEGEIDIPEGDVGDNLPCDTVEQCRDLFKRGLLAVSNENYVHVEPAERGNLVSTFMIVGDTGGDDISDDNNPKDDTRIAAIAFNPVRLDLEGTPTGRTPPTGTGSSTTAPGGVGRTSSALRTSNICANQVQGKIAWDYKGHKIWGPNNIDRLCEGAEQSVEPAVCFNRVMHGGINWGGGTFWNWKNALDLCEGTRSAESTIGCFQGEIQKQRPWSNAIRTCNRQ